MAKSLQEQLLAAGLIDKQKAKKAAKELKKQDHLQRTGQDNQIDEAKAKADAARKEKAERDRELNQKKEQEAQQKAIAAQVRQLVTTNAIKSEYADIKYQFVDGKKVKSIYVDQAIWDRLSRGQLAVIALDLPGEKKYEVLPLQIAEKIRQRKDNHFIYIAESTADAMDEDDPYAAYQIPDDLMW
ncbi:DUF2058 domain-containing protein [Thalassolituus alkanivorans]|jgi:uncharacterized protein YaiL (DUF2058 family)|uniref:DUF2058 domain-containing protein n=1 Tax=Thalassolituus alkanivorans TaxID=2881055 RepID=UPI000C3E1D30|nr:DUF2058 domain-containing protein [Thalassolituus alkanivorans]MCB2386676.1 DUF2058 domain-containing protein [Thalassolituus alkanivorans]MCB2424146.1 DUF2058 domain-containing protein [Thalassolituus alkanivorans]PIQ40122.1 MAG: nucleoprotein/polynucleotide-associated enzyme [Thalassolituus sp. CG17_big_fil_post_rev_8_21_14_2_50_53_8]